MATYNTLFVDIDVLKDRSRRDVYNSRRDNYAGFDMIVSGTLAGVTCSIACAALSFGPTVITEGVQWFQVLGDEFQTLVNLLAAIAKVANCPLTVRHPVYEQAGDARGRAEALSTPGSWGENITLQFATANAANIKVNTVAGPHATPLPGTGGDMPKGNSQLDAILNTLSPVPISNTFTHVNIEALGRESTQFRITWISA